MAKYEFVLSGIGSMMFGKPVSEPKQDGETHDQHDARTWKQKVSTTPSGQCCLQPFALTNALMSAGSRLSVPVPGNGKATFTKLFRQGCMCVDPLLLWKPDGAKMVMDDVSRVQLTRDPYCGALKAITIEDLDPQRLFVPSDGKRGSSKRVFRTFPTVYSWKATGSLFVYDGKITQDILRRHMIEAGKFIGFGSMRVENGGICGRFAIEDLIQGKE